MWKEDKGGGMMERLTKKGFNFTATFIKRDIDSWSIAQCLKKLQKYEDLEDQNLLLQLPCNIGDTVYAYCSEFGILQYTVDCIIINEHITYQCSSYSEPIGDCPSECLDEIEPDITDFSKTVFLTQTEAEQKLKEMESDCNDKN